jgi:VWFA-related protein
MKNSFLGRHAAILAMSVACFGQASQQSDKPYILIPVVATDASGAPASGLKAEDFLIAEGHAKSAPSYAEEVKPFLLPSDSAGQQKRPVFLVLDKLTINGIQLGNVERSVLQFLARSLETGEPTTLLVIDSDGVKSIHSLSTAPEVLAAALQQLDSKTHILGGHFNSPFHTNLDEPTKRRVEIELAALEGLGTNSRPLAATNAAAVQMEAIQRIGNAGRSQHGRKAIFLITNEIYLQFNDVEEKMTFRGDSNFDTRGYTIQYEGMIEALNAGQVSVYPTVFTEMDSTGRFASTGVVYWRNIGVTLDPIAKATGGVVVQSSSDLTPAVSGALQQCQGYYLLTQAVTPAAKSITWTKLHIIATRKDTHLRFPNGYFDLPVHN